jgi:hypothetical protein
MRLRRNVAGLSPGSMRNILQLGRYAGFDGRFVPTPEQLAPKAWKLSHAALGSTTCQTTLKGELGLLVPALGLIDERQVVERHARVRVIGPQRLLPYRKRSPAARPMSEAARSWRLLRNADRSR